jgi:uncharacterized membrane protein (DUF4010 family)
MTQIEEYQKFIELLQNPLFLTGFIILIVWSLVWKGIALWKAAQNGHKVWYIVILIANTVGILEIIYIYLYSKNEK